MFNVNGNINVILDEGDTKGINICRDLLYCKHISTYPCDDNSTGELYLRSFIDIFISCHFSLPHHLRSQKVELFGHHIYIFIHGREILIMEGNSVLPMHAVILCE